MRSARNHKLFGRPEQDRAAVMRFLASGRGASIEPWRLSRLFVENRRRCTGHPQGRMSGNARRRSDRGRTRGPVRRARRSAGYLPLDKLLPSNGNSLPITLEKGGYRAPHPPLRATTVPSRLKGLRRPLGRSVLISGAIAAETTTSLVPLGDHVLRGVPAPCNFTVPDAEPGASTAPSAAGARLVRLA